MGSTFKTPGGVEVPRAETLYRKFGRLREEGYAGGYTAVKDVVRGIEQKSQAVFVPLAHPPGEARVDFGQALVRMNGRLRKVAMFVMALPYSNALFVMAFERECTESFWEGHVRAFEFFGGVPTRIVYDNTRVAVAKILGRERKLTRGFCECRATTCPLTGSARCGGRTRRESWKRRSSMRGSTSSCRCRTFGTWSGSTRTCTSVAGRIRTGGCAARRAARCSDWRKSGR